LKGRILNVSVSIASIWGLFIGKIKRFFLKNADFPLGMGFANPFLRKQHFV
jgi:hypothetical protein